MQDETKLESERHFCASSPAKSVSDRSEERLSHALTLAPGDQLTGLSVFQIDQPHQRTLVQLAEATARQGKANAGIQGSAIFRALGKGDVAVLTQWLNQEAYTQAETTLLKPPE